MKRMGQRIRGRGLMSIFWAVALLLAGAMLAPMQAQACTSQIGNLVWHDVNGNGKQDPGEPGIPGVQMILKKPDKTTVTTTTDSNGNYLFSNLCLDVYYTVSVDSASPALAGFTPTIIKATGVSSTLDSNDPNGATTKMNSLYPNDLTIDFGYIKANCTSKIGDFVWHDLNGNGLQDSGEPGIAGVTIILTRPDGTKVTTTTDSNGRYIFENLCYGKYYTITVDAASPALAGFVPTKTYQDGSAVDSNNHNGTSIAIDDNCPSDITIDFGYVKPPECIGQIGNFVWNDLNGNGRQDAGEPGIGGVKITLTLPDNSKRTTTTDSNGFYLFDKLCYGKYYTVTVDASSPALAGFAPTLIKASGVSSTLDSNDARGAITALSSDYPSDLTLDFGYIQCVGKIGDFVWHDLNGNGIQDSGEPGIGGVTLILTRPDGSKATTTTNSSGYYLFSNLCYGFYYTVAVDASSPALAGFTPTLTYQGGSEKDSNNHNGTIVGLKDDCKCDLSIDFGYVKLPKCDLALEKTCETPALPPSLFVCSDAKPIDSLTMIWGGTETITVKAWKGAVGSTLLATITNVTPGQRVTVSGYAGSPNDVVWEIFSTSGAYIGKSTFHVSCSDADMNGPEDCGKAQGDGKGLTGFINKWILDGMAGNGQSLVCTTEPSPPTNKCELQLGPAPGCSNAGKPKTLTFRYTGGGCSMSNNTQAADKTGCTPTGTLSDPVSVKAAGNSNLTKDVYDVNPSQVTLGEEFTLSFGGADLKADSYIEISSNSGKELDRIHTSCSQPLKVGDVFGSLTLVAYNGQTLGNEVEYTYTLTNNGDPVKSIILTDDKLGTIAEGFNLGSGEKKTFSATAAVTQTITNVATASGVQEYNKTCASAPATATVTVKSSTGPFVCANAKPIDSLSMVWNGTQTVKIKAWKGAVGSTLLATIDNIVPGQEVTVSGYAGSPNDVYWEIFKAGTNDKIGTSTFHVSCSDADMNGPEDCGKAAGDGKGKTGYINQWRFAGMEGNGQVLDCGVLP